MGGQTEVLLHIQVLVLQGAFAFPGAEYNCKSSKAAGGLYLISSPGTMKSNVFSNYAPDSAFACKGTFPNSEC